MATIVNDRDVLLQAAATRVLPMPLPDNIVIPELRGINITAPTLAFKVDTSGVATPSSITLTANLKVITGTVSWSVVAGSASLTGSGDTRNLAYADMGSDFVTIQAQLTFEAVTYTSQVSIYKVRDGDRGTVGTLNGYGAAYGMIVASWADSDPYTASPTNASDDLANRVIYNMLTGESNTSGMTQITHLLRGDQVTLSDGSAFAKTKFWDGTAWISPGMVLDGHLIVNGTVSADKVTAGSIQTGFAANARIKIGSNTFISGITSPLHVEKLSATANQTLISARNDQDDSVAIWGGSVWANGNAVSGTWHSSTTESNAGRWQMIGLLGSNLYGAAVAGNVYGTQQGAAFRYYSGANSASPGSLTSTAGFATSTHAGTFGGRVELTGTGSPLRLNGSDGTAGYVLTSQGTGNTPTWTDPAAGSVTYSSIQTALGGTTGTPLDLTTTFRSTGTNAPVSGSGVELAYLTGTGYLIACTRTAGGAVGSYSPLNLQGSTISLNQTPTFPTPAVGTDSTAAATTAYVVDRIAQDAPTKTGSGASGTWSINVSGTSGSTTGSAGSVGGYKCFGGAGTSDGSGNITINFPSSFTNSTSYGATANGLSGINVVITAATASSVTFQTQNASSGAAVATQAIRWTAVGT